MTAKFSAIFLLLIFTFLYLVPLQSRPLFIPDETRYAEVPREMVASGDWIVPRINGLRYFEKPVMGYWFTAVSISIFGENNFAVRLPSALAAGLTALIIFFLCHFCFGPECPIPSAASLIYLTSLGVATTGTFAVLDPVLTMFLTATMAAFFLATEERAGSSSERKFLFTAGLFAGCAFLTKGFLAFAVPVLVAGPYLVLQKRWRDTIRMLWLPITGAVVVSLPWTILIHIHEPQFWYYFFWHEHIHRFLSDSAQHVQPFWFFLAVLPAMFMPWVFLLPAAVFGAFNLHLPAGPQKRLISYSLCWIMFPFLFFSASSGKLVTYILPCFIPLSIFFAYGLSWWLNLIKIENRHLQLGIGALFFLVVCLLPIIAGLHLLGPDNLHIFQRSWKWLLLSSCIVVMALLLLIALRSNIVHRKLTFYAISFAVLLFTAHFAIPNLTLNRKAPGPLIGDHNKDITPDTIILSGEDVVRAACWYLKRNDIYLVERAGELQYGLDHDDSSHRKLSPEQAGSLIREHRNKVVLIADQNEYSRWQEFFPSPVSVDSNGSKGYLLINY